MSSKSLVPFVSPMYKRILSLFPKDSFKYSFAYGSGVFKQGNACETNPMIDLILAVDNPVDFHKQNILLNPSHYSSMKFFGHDWVTKIQELWPAKVYFNTLIYIKEEDIMIKYGVVKKLHLIDDLYDWDYIYLAGRLHKPVLEIGHANGELKSALSQNLFNAVHAALLLLPDNFTELQLYRTISNLSYEGDFRMIVGENKNKVNNIVENQVNHFRQLYRPILSQLNDYIFVPNEETIEQRCMQDTSPVARLYHLYQLPKTPQQALVKYCRANGGKRKDTEDVLRDLSQNHDVGDMLALCLRKLVFKSSSFQSLKGILTAGLTKSIIYSNKKIVKMLQSK